jgi:pyruvate/2-oxoglutarate/acetoin dehydrogenase E1 component
MREWIIESGIATNETLVEFERAIKREVKEAKKNAWDTFLRPILKEQQELLLILKQVASVSVNGVFIEKSKDTLAAISEPTRKDILSIARKVLVQLIGESSLEKEQLTNWINTIIKQCQPYFSSHLYSETHRSNVLIKEVKASYDDDAAQVDGRIILRDNFDSIFHNYPEALIFGEDTGKIGDVNQGLEGLQEKYGELRVADTGIREATIIGQGIGMALRGLRPIAEIQYLDYILYAIQIISDDLATTQYRTKGKQKAPLIIRTRGHRLEGVWHSGSQMGGILNLARGINLLVPRNMTKAAGFYNTLLAGDDPAIIIECLNGYRLKEKMPNNLSSIKTPIGVVETVKEGVDITLVSYGSTLRIVEQVAKDLMALGIDAEVIDVQSLLPFDLNHDISKSIKKTNRVMIIDEDAPGGASAYILNEILNTQNAYHYLDSQPKTLTAKAHRPAYGDDGDYFSKPSAEDIFEAIYDVMREVKPSEFPKLR